jgi:anaerobic carbon-monoxide dehydrogenase, CODH/ACS complex subunit epsilon
MPANLPYHRVNVLTGTKAARLIEDPAEYASLIRKAARPLLVVGPRALTMSLEGRSLIEYSADLTKAVNMPVCATAHTRKRLVESGIEPASSYDLVEIINHLKDPQWSGVKKEGNHDLVILIGVRTDLAEQGLSTLKHYARHLKTMTLCKYYYPNASYSLPNCRDWKWKEFLDALIVNLKESA